MAAAEKDKTGHVGSEQNQTETDIETLCLLSWAPDDKPFRHQIPTIHTGSYSSNRGQFTTNSGQTIELSGFTTKPEDTNEGHERSSNGEILTLEEALPIHLIYLWHMHFTTKDISPDLDLKNKGLQLIEHLRSDFVLAKRLSISPPGPAGTHISPGKPFGEEKSPYHLLKKPLQVATEKINFNYPLFETSPDDWVIILNYKNQDTLQISLVRGHQEKGHPDSNRQVGVLQKEKGDISFYQHKFEEEPISFDVKVIDDEIKIVADQKIKDLLAQRLGFRGNLESLTRSLLEIGDSEVKVDDRINLKDGSVDQVCNYCGQTIGNNIVIDGILQKNIATPNCSKCSANDYGFKLATTIS